jgi:hypothetical protein
MFIACNITCFALLKAKNLHIQSRYKKYTINTPARFGGRPPSSASNYTKDFNHTCNQRMYSTSYIIISSDIVMLPHWTYIYENSLHKFNSFYVLLPQDGGWPPRNLGVYIAYFYKRSGSSVIRILFIRIPGWSGRFWAKYSLLFPTVIISEKLILLLCICIVFVLALKFTLVLLSIHVNEYILNYYHHY